MCQDRVNIRKNVVKVAVFKKKKKKVSSLRASFVSVSKFFVTKFFITDVLKSCKLASLSLHIAHFVTQNVQHTFCIDCERVDSPPLHHLWSFSIKNAKHPLNLSFSGEDLLFFLVICNNKLNVFGFWLDV